MNNESSETIDINRLTESEIGSLLTVEFVDGSDVDGLVSKFYQDKQAVCVLVYVNFRIVLGTGRHLLISQQVGDKYGALMSKALVKYREGKNPEILFAMPPTTDPQELKVERAVYFKLRELFQT